MLLDMTRAHVPVLAGELIDLTAPAPGETAVDCTFGGGGHARLVAARIGPGGTLGVRDRRPRAAHWAAWPATPPRKPPTRSWPPRWRARPASCGWTTPTRWRSWSRSA